MESTLKTAVFLEDSMKIFIAEQMNASHNEFIDKVNGTKRACNDLEENLEKLWNNGQISLNKEVQNARIEAALKSVNNLSKHADTIFDQTDFKDTKEFREIATKVQIFCVDLMDTLHKFNSSLDDSGGSLSCPTKIKEYQEKLATLENSFPILHRIDHVVMVHEEFFSKVVEYKSITPR